ncbi:MAG: leucine-rich repeat domain-containing protein [Leptolyngbya sp. SIO1D8]|nr:leucine-rich repeat domain-containing protein [Leptolyngbya sp. SIO1D8]
MERIIRGGLSVLLATIAGCGSATANDPGTFVNFADWCLHKAELLPDARHTVDVLLEEAGTQDCRRARRVLASSPAPSLNLTDAQISNVEPLASFENLTRLDLRENQIVDVTPLANLVFLIELYLEGNEISDISPLANLTDLLKLSLDEQLLSDRSCPVQPERICQ